MFLESDESSLLAFNSAQIAGIYSCYFNLWSSWEFIYANREVIQSSKYDEGDSYLE